jgi:hypothetical protein
MTTPVRGPGARRAEVVAVTEGRLDGSTEAPPEPAGGAKVFDTGEQSFYGEFDGRRLRCERVLLKSIGE